MAFSYAARTATSLSAESIPDGLRAAQENLADVLLSTGLHVVPYAGGRRAASTNAYRNVIGVGLGLDTDGPLIDIFVIRSYDSDRDVPLPDRVGEYRTRIKQSGLMVPYAIDPKLRMRPISPGTSISPISVDDVGTIGAILRDASDWYVLSNNHVLAQVDTLRAGEKIVQPGTRDDGALGDVVGELARSVLLPPFGRVDVDCAIARIDCPFEVDIPGIGHVTDVTDPVVNMTVLKYGRSTELTVGTITDVNVAVTVPYSPSTVVTLTRQITIEPRDSARFSERGDSGSLIVDAESHRAVGLLVGGSDDTPDGAVQSTLANNIKHVLAALGNLHLA